MALRGGPQQLRDVHHRAAVDEDDGLQAAAHRAAFADDVVVAADGAHVKEHLLLLQDVLQGWLGGRRGWCTRPAWLERALARAAHAHARTSMMAEAQMASTSGVTRRSTLHPFTESASSRISEKASPRREPLR